MSDFRLQIIKHKELNEELFSKIALLKTFAWAYSIESQKDWMKKNLKEEDLHVLLSINNELVSYLNLHMIEVRVDNCRTKAFGIGNVCSKRRGLGYGSKLLELIKQYIGERNEIAILFCKQELLSFYTKNGFNLDFEYPKQNLFRMSFNCINIPYTYLGEPF